MDKIDRLIAERRDISEELFDCERDEWRLMNFSEFLTYHSQTSTSFIEYLKEIYHETEFLAVLEDFDQRTKFFSYQMMDELDELYLSLKQAKAALQDKESELAFEQRRLSIEEQGRPLRKSIHSNLLKSSDVYEK